MSNGLIQSSIGLDQDQLVEVIIRLCVAVEELIDDHATQVTFDTEVKADIGTIATFQAALTAKLDADAGVNDTDYASSLTEVVAMTASPIATLTAPDPTSSNSLTDLTFTVT
jgi:hypothetical protein